MSARTALLIIDLIDPRLGGDAFARRTLAAACHTGRLASRMRARRMPVIYANDHFGNWHSGFETLLESCRRNPACASQVVASITPANSDFVLLKPRHSAFYGTPLDFLLAELKVTRLILTGVQTDVCVLCTAQDGHMRRLKLWVPRNCVAGPSTRRQSAALDFIRVNLKADVRPFSAA